MGKCLSDTNTWENGKYMSARLFLSGWTCLGKSAHVVNSFYSPRLLFFFVVFFLSDKIKNAFMHRKCRKDMEHLFLTENAVLCCASWWNSFTSFCPAVPFHMSHTAIFFVAQKRKGSALERRQIKGKQLRNDSPGAHVLSYYRFIGSLMI